MKSTAAVHVQEGRNLRGILEEFCHLFTLNLGPDGGLEHQVLQDGSERCDSDSSSHQNGHLKVNPLLMTFTKRAVQIELAVSVERDMGFMRFDQN